MSKMTNTFTPLESAIIKVILYFDIFDYPLNKREIYIYLNVFCTQDEVESTLLSLENSRILYQKATFYLLNDANISLGNNEKLAFDKVNLRKKRNQKATEYLQKAYEISKKIAKFPFIKMVSLSGSISKNSIDEGADIDYFIITAKNRLWIARFFLMLYKKIGLLNTKKFFCINYIIDENTLMLQNQSFYIAMEAITIIPTAGYNVYDEFLEQNNWIKPFFPNFPKREINNTSDSLATNFPTESPLKTWFESLFKGKLGDFIEEKLMQRRHQKWKKRHPEKWNTEKGIDINKNTFKGHLTDHYERIMAKFEEKIKAFEQNNPTQKLL